MVEVDSKDDSIDNSVSVTRQKIIFVGCQAVGKTSIISRIIDNPFNENYEASIGIDFCSKVLRYKGQSIKLQIWDTAGQEKFKSLIPSYVRNSAIVFVVFDLHSHESFEKVQGWIDFIKELENSFLVLCGNKLDLER